MKCAYVVVVPEMADGSVHDVMGHHDTLTSTSLHFLKPRVFPLSFHYQHTYMCHQYIHPAAHTTIPNYKIHAAFWFLL